MTGDGYDPTQPLKWSGLEAEPFLTADHPPLVDGVFTMTGRLPAGKHGRHVIYAIYQRSDSPEAFYACSDVIFDGSGSCPPHGSQAAKPASEPSTPVNAVRPYRRMALTAQTSGSAAGSGQPLSGLADWQVGAVYAVGVRVTYNGMTYVAVQGHIALPGWEPPNIPALWQAM